MQLIINAEPQTVTENSTVADLIDVLQLQNKRLAIEINKELIPRSMFSTHKLNEGDEVEIVQAIGGG